MPTPIETAPVYDAHQPCNGYCSGYGTRSSCPPLIVLAMQSECPSAPHSLDSAQHLNHSLSNRQNQQQCRLLH
jgi:hypothetical protein